MVDIDKFVDMPITRVVAAWMVEEKWEDEINISDDRKAATISTRFKINDQPHNLYFEIDEESKYFSIFLYSPMSVPPARMTEMARILNRINMRLALGRLACHDDSDSNAVQFLARIDVEGTMLVTRQIHSMLGAALNTMRRYGELLAATALTKQSAETLWASLLEDEALQQAKK
ncbi:YbjN domain-containing protein [Acidiphilium sp.]|uniref:YbjN domain-containing protein n=1 Tax=Acidiphilium sp. TaxID=527 RepID=UPI00258C0F87|nr:YbjN domain-containing protein [Acidiphilium sp.]